MQLHLHLIPYQITTELIAFHIAYSRGEECPACEITGLALVHYGTDIGFKSKAHGSFACIIMWPMNIQMTLGLLKGSGWW